MDITFDLSPQGIESAVKSLRSYKQTFEAKMQEVISRLADIGVEVARYEYANALHTGVNDVNVTVSKNGREATITASGESVLFIEFGTGVKEPEHPLGSSMGYVRGTYGKGKGSNPKGWFYVGEQGNIGRPSVKSPGVYHTYGNPPSMAMYKASKEIEQSIERVISEVFR